MRIDNSYSLDYLNGFEHIKLYQNNNMFKMNSDSCLLGNFIKLKDNVNVLDIGTNNGVLLLYASRFNVDLFCGIDINKDALNLAKYNLEFNNIHNFELFNVDIKYFDYPDKFDVILCNPPYFLNSLKSDNISLMQAKHEDYMPLNTLFSKVSKLLKENGSFYLVHRPNRIQDITMHATNNGLYIKTLQYVYSKKTNSAVTILIEFTNKECFCNLLENKYI